MNFLPPSGRGTPPLGMELPLSRGMYALRYALNLTKDVMMKLNEILYLSITKTCPCNKHFKMCVKNEKFR